MINQKQVLVPKVGTASVSSYDATADFTTEYIEFVNSHKDWSIDVDFSGVVTAATMTILVCNTYNGTYKSYKTLSTDIDMTVLENQVIFDDIMPFRYMKIDYVAGTTTGDISINVIL